ncbi:uncharacterized protein LOC142528036 isoform X2 [Primulina tabacum]|uniref:uncharacterized protein LOC142528036 isoform X2 n=1 Tax=Primulina tabacum TaxID=48773 RepID=UPI003F598F73
MSSSINPLHAGGSKPSCGEVVDVVSCGSLNLREPNDASTGHPDINKGISGVVKRFKQRRSRTNNHASDSLSDIDDAEVSRYLNTKEEMHYKRMLWEDINGKYVNKQKKAAERKKGSPLKKAAKTMEKVKSTVSRRSSRVNYEALKILNEELLSMLFYFQDSLQSLSNSGNAFHVKLVHYFIYLICIPVKLVGMSMSFKQRMHMQHA